MKTKEIKIESIRKEIEADKTIIKPQIENLAEDQLFKVTCDLERSLENLNSEAVSMGDKNRASKMIAFIELVLGANRIKTDMVIIKEAA